MSLSISCKKPDTVFVSRNLSLFDNFISWNFWRQAPNTGLPGHICHVTPRHLTPSVWYSLLRVHLVKSSNIHVRALWDMP